jgi:beta-lactam-binding protein with PASTA domain
LKEPAIPGQSLPLVSTQLPTGGTVVLDMEQGGIVVPSFIGKSVRAAVETAEETGLDLDAVGSGLAHEQQPPPGSRVAAGTRIMVHFGR